MGIFDYNCSWCHKSFGKNSVTKVSRVGTGLYGDMFLCIGLNKPNYSVRMLHNYLCKSCAKKYNKALAEIDNAWANLDEVELVSASYMGKKRYDPTQRLEINTTWERDWDYARDLLKALALYYGYDMVIDVEKEVRTKSERSNSGKGTHYYKVARYSGVAVVRI